MIFVHCFDCRVPVTPSGRQPLITEPPTGDRASVEALHDMTLASRAGRPVAAHEVAVNVASLHAALGLDVALGPVEK